MEEDESESRQHVLERDQYKCILCIKSGVHVHEIVPRSTFGKLNRELLFNPKNRVCLCPVCHSGAHTFDKRVLLIRLLRQKFGYNYTEKEFQKYL